MEKIKNPYLGKEGYRCICCSPENPIGLHLSFYEDGDDVADPVASVRKLSRLG